MAKKAKDDDEDLKSTEVLDAIRQPDGKPCVCDALAVPHIHTPTGVEYA